MHSLTDRCVTLVALLSVVLMSLVICEVARADQNPDGSRSARILANLMLQFPELNELDPIMNEIEPTRFEGLDQGSLMIQGRPFTFLVSTDDAALYFLQDEVLDVSLSWEEIETGLARREAEEARAGAQRRQAIADAIAGHPMRGNVDAPVTIVEFADFQCSFCARAETILAQVMEAYGQETRFVFKHSPLEFHDWATPAAIASNCAAAQSPEAFWSLHDLFFERQDDLNQENLVATARERLEESGIDLVAWEACAVDSSSAEHRAVRAQIDADLALGRELGVNGTPGFFVNGTFVDGAQPFETFESLILATRLEEAMAHGDALRHPDAVTGGDAVRQVDESRTDDVARRIESTRAGGG